MLQRWAILWQRRDLVLTLVHRDLRMRYKGSVLGLLWSLIHPLALGLVYTVAFQFVIRIHIENYVVFLLSGLLPWLFFSSSLLTAVGSIVDQGQLVKKVAFPREVLPLAAVLAQLVHFTIAYLVVIPAFGGYQIGLGLAYLALPLLMLLLLIFTSGFALATATLQVYMRDTNHLLSLLLQIWFWVTPIIYSLDLIPERFRILALLNPLALFVTSFHQIVVALEFPDVGRLALLVALTAVVFVAGYAVFMWGNARMAEYV